MRELASENLDPVCTSPPGSEPLAALPSGTGPRPVEPSPRLGALYEMECFWSAEASESQTQATMSA